MVKPTVDMHVRGEYILGDLSGHVRGAYIYKCELRKIMARYKV